MDAWTVTDVGNGVFTPVVYIMIRCYFRGVYVPLEWPCMHMGVYFVCVMRCVMHQESRNAFG